VVAEITPTTPVAEAYSLATWVALDLRSESIMPKLFALLGAVALALALVGMYGVMSFAVTQRTQELGLRRALGAPTGTVLALVLRQGLAICAAGAVVGIALTALVSRALASFLFGVSAFDPVIFIGVTAALFLIASIAILAPARRATAVDAIVALRAE
jgi:ABC-type antimicrobial peptide transport system permease subunit